GTGEAQVDDVDVELDAIIESLQQVAESPAGEDLEDVDLGLRHESAEHLARLVTRADDAGAMRAVTDDVLQPALRVGPLRQVDTVSDVSQQRMAGVGPRIHECDPDTLAGERFGDAVEAHQDLSPAVAELDRKPSHRLLQRAQPHHIDLAV